MTPRPHIRPPGGWSGPVPSLTGPGAELHLAADLQTLRVIVDALDRLEERLNVSPIPQAVAQRGYFTPDEDDRVRQGVLVYRNCRLAAYEIILRYRNYALHDPRVGRAVPSAPHFRATAHVGGRGATRPTGFMATEQFQSEQETSLEPQDCRLRCFLVAFGAALLLYGKSLKIIAFAEHVPMLRAKINEPDGKYDLEAGFFDDVLAGYSRLCNYRSMIQADAFWRVHRREAHAFAAEAGGDWAWLVDLIRRQRHGIRNRLLHVLWERLRHDRRAFCHALLSPFRQARQGLEGLLRDRLADVPNPGPLADRMPIELLTELRTGLQPGDVLLVRDDQRLASAILPGFWTHAALYLGGRSDLERLGLNTHPQVIRHGHELPENPGPLGLVIEALCPCVQFNPLEKCLRVDHVAVLRPTLPASEIAAAIGEAVGQLRKPYDFEFDFNNTSRIVCTELVYRSLHHRGDIRFALTKRLGRFTLTGDDIMAHALDAMRAPEASTVPPLQPVALVLKRRDGQPHRVAPERILPLLRRIRRGWHPSRRGRLPKAGNHAA